MIAWEVRIKQERTGYFKHSFSTKEVWGTESWYDTIDVVFFDSDCDHSYVKSSLVNRDGYPSNILVRKQKAK